MGDGLAEKKTWGYLVSFFRQPPNSLRYWIVSVNQLDALQFFFYCRFNVTVWSNKLRKEPARNQRTPSRLLWQGKRKCRVIDNEKGNVGIRTILYMAGRYYLFEYLYSNKAGNYVFQWGSRLIFFKKIRKKNRPPTFQSWRTTFRSWRMTFSSLKRWFYWD